MTIANGTPFEVAKSGTQIDMKWDTTSNELIITTRVPDKTWFAWGWGGSMTQTAMVLWEANGEDSTVTDLYSEHHGYPSTVTDNCYSSSYAIVDGYIEFTTKRPLDCQAANGYVV